MNSHRSLEDSIYRVLKQNKCPLRVYKDIWLYIPHTKNPAINDFHKEIHTKQYESITRFSRGGPHQQITRGRYSSSSPRGSSRRSR